MTFMDYYSDIVPEDFEDEYIVWFW
jgi:hypothetical protein